MGQRRIRIHTISVPITAQLGTLFRHSDMDAILNVMARTGTCPPPLLRKRPPHLTSPLILYWVQ